MINNEYSDNVKKNSGVNDYFQYIHLYPILWRHARPAPAIKLICRMLKYKYNGPWPHWRLWIPGRWWCCWRELVSTAMITSSQFLPEPSVSIRRTRHAIAISWFSIILFPGDNLQKKPLPGSRSLKFQGLDPWKGILHVQGLGPWKFQGLSPPNFRD